MTTLKHCSLFANVYLLLDLYYKTFDCVFGSKHVFYIYANLLDPLCGSRKYPYPHHGGNWKYRRGGGVKDPGNSEGEGGCVVDLVSRGPLIQYRLKCRSSCSKILSYLLSRTFT